MKKGAEQLKNTTMAYIESEWSIWHSFSATAYLYNKSGANWQQIVSYIAVLHAPSTCSAVLIGIMPCYFMQASDSRVDIVVKHSTEHQFLRLSAKAGGLHLFFSVVFKTIEIRLIQ